MSLVWDLIGLETFYENSECNGYVYIGNSSVSNKKK